MNPAMINSKLGRDVRQFVRHDGWFSIPRKLLALAEHAKNKI